MQHPEVISLYKYRSFNQYSLQLLINQASWFSCPSSFNDPFDCAVNLDSSRLEDNVKHALDDLKIDIDTIPKELRRVKSTDIEAFESFRSSISKMFQKCGILSLSEINNDILMWAHYANSHTGFAIEYERTSENKLGKDAQPVIYTSKIPSLTGRDICTRGGKFDALWLTKSKHWCYEKEWRVLNTEGNKAFTFPCKIKSIIFGMRMTPEDRWTIRKILEHQDIEFLEALQSEKYFEIEIHKSEH